MVRAMRGCRAARGGAESSICSDSGELAGLGARDRFFGVLLAGGRVRLMMYLWGAGVRGLWGCVGAIFCAI